MKHNVGGSERLARLGVGTLLLVVGAVGYVGFVNLAWTGIGQALTAVLLAIAGLILLATGALSWCPINAAIGRKSAAASEPEGTGSETAGESEPIEAERPA